MTHFSYLIDVSKTVLVVRFKTRMIVIPTVVRLCCCVRALIAGGGAPEIELSIQLMEYAQTLAGVEQYCFRAFADALEIIPFTLAENAGLNPIATVTELRNRHSQGEKTSGINVRKVSNM